MLPSLKIENYKLKIETFQIGNTNRQVVEAWRGMVGDRVRIDADNGWSQRRVLFFLLKARAVLLTKKIASKAILSQYNYQTIPCIPLVEIDQSECPCAPASGCRFLRSKYPIPLTINGFKAVTSIIGNIRYSPVDWDKIKYKLSSRMSAERTAPYYTLKTGKGGTYLYVHNDIHKAQVTVTAIFDNPIDVQCYPDCEGKIDRCIKPLDKPFILDPELSFTLYDTALASLLPYKNRGTDVVQNEQDDQAASQVVSPTLK